MTYTSIIFLLVFPIIVLLYWTFFNKYRGCFLLLVNFGFIGLFSIRDLVTIVLISVVTYLFGIIIEKNKDHKKQLYKLFVLFYLLLFTYFKFSNYFIKHLNSISEANFSLFNIIVPIGYSFYMIQCIMFISDVKENRLRISDVSITDFIVFNTYFLSFIQGPINRFQNFKENFLDSNDFDQNKFLRGLKLFSIGLFKKLIITSRLAILSSGVFDNSHDFSGRVIFFGMIVYSLELYFDFSSAVDMSRGASYLLGIELPINFNKPYFATSIRDFWSKWHISLTSFFRNYVYFPLGGSRKGKTRQYANIMIIFVLSALWHGTGLNFLVWGIYHAVLQIFEIAFKVGVYSKNWIVNSLRRVVTFLFVSFGWLIFRADGIKDFLRLLTSMFLPYKEPIISSSIPILSIDLAILILSLIVVFMGGLYDYDYFEQKSSNNEVRNWGIIFIVFVIVLVFGLYGPGYSSTDFIYMGF